METIILFNEADLNASVYTCNGKWKRMLAKLASEHVTLVRLVDEDGFGAVTYELPKKLLSLRAPRVYTDEQRRAMSERAGRHLTARAPVSTGAEGIEEVSGV
jgi:hypothetical protein